MADYHRLNPNGNNEEDIDLGDGRPIIVYRRSPKSAIRPYLLVFTSFVVGVLTTALSVHFRHIVHPQEHPAYTHKYPLLTPPGYVPKDLTSNDTFWLWSPESDKAWRSIIPNGLGFVQHPDIGPEIVSLAFVHQLHCVDMLHQGYLKARKGQATNETNRHTTHCLEYLRQSVICNADPNLEYRQEISPGVLATLGDGMHQCRDYDQIHAFAEKWRVFNGQTVKERKKISEEENIPGRVINYDYVSSRGDPVPF